MCDCVYASAEDGMAFGKWRVPARTCQKGPQSSGSRSLCVYVSVCAVKNRGAENVH